MTETATAEAPKKEKAEKPKVERKSLHNLLWKAFAANWSYDTIVKRVADEFPDSKFNLRSEMHYRYYRVKYNQDAKARGVAETTSEQPERKARAVKEPKAPKEAKSKKEAKAPAEAK